MTEMLPFLNRVTISFLSFYMDGRGDKTYIHLLYLLKVDVDESPAIATAENVRILPTFKIYKQGSCIKEVVSPSPEVLESLVRHYTI